MSEFYTKAQADAQATAIGEAIKKQPVIIQLGGQFLLDPNEVNGWGNIGRIDNSYTQDLGNVGAATMNRLAGGVLFPYGVKIVRMEAWHRNSNAAALPWGWVLARQSKTAGNNTVSTTFMLDESSVRSGIENGSGLRDYSNNSNQYTDFTTFTNDVIPAGETIVLGVGSPTAVTTNYYVQVMSGFIQFERV